jgi:lysophospholipase L1-like esterase
MVAASTPHVVLLGDSILDNSAYTRGQPDVVTHLRGMLPHPWRATLAAVDGATTGSMALQLSRVPRDATHLVVSIGGNDALGNTDLLRTAVTSTSEALALFAARVARFEKDYRAALQKVRALERETIICTIYNGNLEADVATIARVALTTFNDVILRYAIQQGLAALELRLICSDPSDYANPIEPSGPGGRKIATAIAQAVGALPATAPQARVMGCPM